MNNYNYYTPIELAQEIIKKIPRDNYRSVIDICCGTWNLLSAAKICYPKAEYIGVDIEKKKDCNALKDATFVLNDGRAFSEEEKLAGRTYDLILSNPPFGRMNDNEVYWKEKKAYRAYSALMGKRYESEMVLANINLAHDGSVLMFILPITFVSGDSYKKARVEIAETFSVLEIIDLPDDAFGCNDLRTVALIIKKENAQRRDTKHSVAKHNRSSWRIDKHSTISYENIKKGNWVGKKDNEARLIIKRGKIHSGNLIGGKFKVLHCSSSCLKGEWIPSTRYTDEKPSIYAEPGDVIINRVGRGAGYWSIHNGERVAISDCLFVVKNSNPTVNQILQEKTTDGKLDIPIRGISTGYITKSDIYSLIE